MGVSAKRFANVACIAFLALTTSVWGQSVIPFDFQRLPGADQNNRPNAICNIPGEADVHCNRATDARFNLSRDQTTSFIQETVNINGVDYYHIVVGQPDQDFALEYLIETGTRRFFGNRLSESGGGTCFVGPRTPPSQFDTCIRDNNGRNPLLSYSEENPDAAFVTGNGSGIPTAVIIRQVMNSTVTDPNTGVVSNFEQEFLKGSFETKPKITQRVYSDAFDSLTVIDMSAIDYNTDTESGVLTNTLTLNDETIPEASRSFDFADVATQANVDSGRYVYRPGFTSGRPDGDYIYWDNTVDPVKNINWEGFTDISQNERLQ